MRRNIRILLFVWVATVTVSAAFGIKAVVHAQSAGIRLERLEVTERRQSEEMVKLASKVDNNNARLAIVEALGIERRLTLLEATAKSLEANSDTFRSILISILSGVGGQLLLSIIFFYSQSRRRAGGDFNG
jgi:hypothetical protein